MIVVIDNSNRRLFAPQLEQMSLMHQGEEALWPRPVPHFGGNTSGNGADGGNVIHIADLDRSHSVISALKLTPTVAGNLLYDRHPQTALPARSPAHSRVYKISHWLSADAEDAAHEGHGHLFAALFEYSLKAGLTHLNLVCDLELLPLLLEFEWSVIPLGLPVADGDRDFLAVVVDVSHSSVFTAGHDHRPGPEQAAGGLH